MHYAILSFLILFGCASSKSSINKQLIYAAEVGDTKTVLRLIAEGADPDYQDETGWNAYLEASTNGHLETMKVLLAFKFKTEPSGY